MVMVEVKRNHPRADSTFGILENHLAIILIQSDTLGLGYSGQTIYFILAKFFVLG
jgi:hypothetical protein